MSNYYNYFGTLMKTSGTPTTWLKATAANQTLTGGAGNDSLSDGEQAGITLVGGSGDNIYTIGMTGTSGRSATFIQQAASGINTINAYASYALPTNIEVGIVYGAGHSLAANGQGDLLIAANAGATLISGGGSDVLVGYSGGGDTLRFIKSTGYDAVYNFIGTGSTHDTVDLSAYSFTSFAQVQAALAQQGANVVLTLDANDAILFENTTLSAFAAADFVLSAASSSPPSTSTPAPPAPPPPPAPPAGAASSPNSPYNNFYGASMKQSGASAHWFSATAAGQTLTGAAGNNQMSDGNHAAVTMVGGSGDNIYSLGVTSTIPDESSAVIKQAATGTNTVDTYANYALPANIEVAQVYGHHSVIANSQGDLLFAENSWANLVAGTGNDVLVGDNAGIDRFVFNANTGHDAVYNFIGSGSTHDWIELDGYGFTSFSQVQAAMTQQGSDVLLKLDANDAVLFKNTTVSAFNADDFLLDLNETKLGTLTPAFDDEFNSLSLYNPTTGTGVWKTNFAFGSQGTSTSRTLPATGELELYVDPSYAGSGASALGINPFSVSNGILSITANPTPAADLAALGNYKYTSGLITTQKSFNQEYGYFEIKAQLPSGKGMWPAFWLLPTSGATPAEIDIFEQTGSNSVYQTAHSSVAAANQEMSSFIPNLTSGYHTFGLLWTAESITWYIDGAATFSEATPSDLNQPMYMLANLAVGGNWVGSPTSSSEFPASLKIDYVHAYTLQQMNGIGDGAPVQTFTGTGVNDTFLVDNSADKVVEPVNTGNNTVQAAVNYTLPANVQNLTMVGTDNLVGTGNSLNNVITANSGNDTLNGLGGANTLIGGSGHDTFVFNTLSNVATEVVKTLTTLDTIDMSAFYSAGHEAAVSTSGFNTLLTFNTGEVIELVGVSAARISINAQGLLHMI
jgi:beta-glucanase (GH16 family)